MAVPLDKYIEYTYEKQGGWKAATAIFSATLSYEDKLSSIRDQFGINRRSAERWYAHYNKGKK